VAGSPLSNGIKGGTWQLLDTSTCRPPPADSRIDNITSSVWYAS
jgi:hypothetical protein